MKTHTTNSKAVNIEINSIKQSLSNRCTHPKSTDKTTIIVSTTILFAIPSFVLILNYFGLIHNI